MIPAICVFIQHINYCLQSQSHIYSTGIAINYVGCSLFDVMSLLQSKVKNTVIEGSIAPLMTGDININILHAHNSVMVQYVNVSPHCNYINFHISTAQIDPTVEVNPREFSFQLISNIIPLWSDYFSLHIRKNM